MCRERPCPVNCCKTWIGEQLMCARHYRLLPDSVLAAIERARRASRRLDSPAYLAACRTAVDWVNRRQRARARARARVRVTTRMRFASAFHN